MNQTLPELVITPKPRVFDISLSELKAKFALALLLARRDVVAGSKQTILGPFWIIAQPLISTSVFVVVFSYIGSMSTHGRPPFLFYLCGLVGWNYFIGVLNKVTDTFTANAGIFGKVYFPRILVPFAGLMSVTVNSLMQFGFFFVLLAGMGWATGKVPFSWSLFLAVPAFFQLGIVGLAMGFIFTALTSKYKDLVFLLGVITQVWFYVSPVLYPMSQVPENWQPIFLINPTAAPLELLRYSLIGGPAVPASAIAASFAGTVFLLGFGVYLFQVAEKTFIDTV